MRILHDTIHLKIYWQFCDIEFIALYKPKNCARNYEIRTTSNFFVNFLGILVSYKFRCVNTNFILVWLCPFLHIYHFPTVYFGLHVKLAQNLKINCICKYIVSYLRYNERFIFLLDLKPFKRENCGVTSLNLSESYYVKTCILCNQNFNC